MISKAISKRARREEASTRVSPQSAVEIGSVEDRSPTIPIQHAHVIKTIRAIHGPLLPILNIGFDRGTLSASSALSRALRPMGRAAREASAHACPMEVLGADAVDRIPR